MSGGFDTMTPSSTLSSTNFYSNKVFHKPSPLMTESHQYISHPGPGYNNNQNSPSSSITIKPNFPENDPIFIIPEIPPSLTTIASKKKTNTIRAPPPGYDMKTLRKQIEYLNTVRTSKYRQTYHILYRFIHTTKCRHVFISIHAK